MSRLDELVRLVTDPENQPHQYVGEPRKFESELCQALAESVAKYIDTIPPVAK